MSSYGRLLIIIIYFQLLALRFNLVVYMCRFHALEEFDEGKRSCRRRLAGHNRRRRKTHPENPTNGVSLNDERTSSYLLAALLRVLSNIQRKLLFFFYQM